MGKKLGTSSSIDGTANAGGFTGGPVELAVRLISWLVTLNPFLRYALVPLGVAAGVFLITRALGITQATTFVASGVVAAFTIFFFLTSKVVAAERSQLRRPIAVLVWFFTVLFMVVVAATFAGVAAVLWQQFWPGTPEDNPNSAPGGQSAADATEPVTPASDTSAPQNCLCEDSQCKISLAKRYSPTTRLEVLVAQHGDVIVNGLATRFSQCAQCAGCRVELLPPVRSPTHRKVPLCYRHPDGSVAQPCKNPTIIPWVAGTAGSQEQCPQIAVCQP